jgi:hypothetical protein
MQLFEEEIEDARKRLAECGRDAADFGFKVSHLPPDPDGGGMFTARYMVAITDARTQRSLELIGGIGLRWVDAFVEALRDGDFDQ